MFLLFVLFYFALDKRGAAGSTRKKSFLKIWTYSSVLKIHVVVDSKAKFDY